MNIRIDRLDHYGRGIGLYDNKVTFIDNALVDELIEYKIYKICKNYNLARNIRVLEKSNDRVIPECKYYNLCGGCNLEHMSFNCENKFKCDKVKNIMMKFAKIEVDELEIVSEEPYNYRNKITLNVSKNSLCLLKEKSNELVIIDKCMLVHPKINSVIEVINNILKDEDDIEKVMIRLGNKTEEVMISISGDIKNINKFKAISNSLIVNNKAITGNYITSYIGNKLYHVRNNSFFQINNNVTLDLYNYIKSLLISMHSKNLLDLYCGVGTIGIYVCDVVDSVCGVEVVEDAYLDALENAKLNGVNNIKFLNGKVEDIIDKINDIKKYDTIVVDPPRAGLDKKTKDFLKNINAINIIYVSCDPITLARDLFELKEKYTIKSIKLFNMFPRTYHCESVVVLEKIKILDTKISI